MKLIVLVLMFIVVMAGCGKNEPIPPVTVTQPIQQQTAQPTQIQLLVQQYNGTRLAEGQDQVSPGLDCSMYTVPNTTTSIATATLTSVGSFNFSGVFNQVQTPVTNGLNILPKNVQNVLQTYFVVKCTGILVVADNNWHEFDLTSDDGSRMYIDGTLLNNDGLHSSTTVIETKFLSSGIHSFELDFFQASGQQSLILNEDGAVMSNEGYYH